MKKLFTLTLGLAFATFAYSQTERVVLVEEGTNASCGPCASQNPAFHALLEANPDNVVTISYQVWWPGFDPMYEDNEADVDVRVPYYGIQGAPTAVINGMTPDGDTPGFDAAWYAGAPGGYSQEIIDDMAAIPASFEIGITYDYSPEGINVEATATCTQDVSGGDLRLHVVVVEKHIYFDSAPGSNGEDEFYRVMKKMLPSAAGLEMAGSYSVGESMVSAQSWDLSTVYDMDEVAVIAFVQDNDTKEVLQAAIADDGVFAALYVSDAAAINAEDPGTLCSSVVNPMVEIRNHGSETMTSLDINYDVNGTTGTYNWTGSLAFYEAEMVELGDIDFTQEANNSVEVTLENPNGNSDENAANDNLDYPVTIADETTTFVTVTLLLDDYPAETSWEFTDENGDVVEDGGPYAAGQANEEVVAEVQMGDLGCYKFQIMDSYGDGLNGAAWGGDNGNYTVSGSDGVVILSGGGAEQWSEENTRFSATSFVSGIEDVLATASFNLFPNPTAGNLSVELELLSAQKVTIDVYDMVGKIVYSEDFGTMSAGYSLKALDVNQLNTGVYMMNVNVGESSIVSKFVVRH